MKRKILAVASGGGHWVQLRRLRPAFEGQEVIWVTTLTGYAFEPGERSLVVGDANLSTKWRLMGVAMQVLWVLLRTRPHVVVTTGAAPGFLAVVLGRLLGIKTVWIDSMANSEVLSVAGSKVGRWADVWLTQWPHLAQDGGPSYWGSVL